MSDHVCHEGNDPRRAGWCVQCGHQMPGPPTRPRNPDFEREIVEHAAHGIMDPAALLERMNARASSLSGEYVTRPADVALDRDRPREVREEVEDAMNHAAWWLEDHMEHPRALERAESLKWLAAFYAAWSDED